MKTFILLSAVMAVALASNNEIEKILNDGNNVFTSKFFEEVVKEKPGESVVMSAFSVMQPLAQLALASVGHSHDEILKVIGLPNDNVTKEVFPLVNSRLRAVKGVELKMANKIYLPLDAKIKEDFGALSKSVFGSEFKNIDFAEPEPAAKEINEWVEDHTNHRIKNLVNSDSFSDNTRAVLVNALYFKGSWLDKFDKALTTDRDFHVSKDKTVQIPTMFKKAEFKFAESHELDAKLLELPYEGEEASMLIILPNEIDGLPALQEKLKVPSALETAIDNMYKVEVNVYLPKFKIETQIDLKKILMSVGVNDLFDSATARLNNLLENESGLFVSNAIQKAFIEVNEEGAEAAAANAFMVAYADFVGPTPPKPEFRADRPFLYILKSGDNKLFSGVFAN
ncbi:alaserpin-like isoform X6 [Choristoneura fumiferana]|uniref:alaserpin-like isoform X6 n=1 Tax=Choristoneura fumiferana TaxID=7141 RepID=UPI003D15729E